MPKAGPRPWGPPAHSAPSHDLVSWTLHLGLNGTVLGNRVFADVVTLR